MQGTFETQRIIRTRPINEKVKERRKYSKDKTLRTREREASRKGQEFNNSISNGEYNEWI